MTSTTNEAGTSGRTQTRRQTRQSTAAAAAAANPSPHHFFDDPSTNNTISLPAAPVIQTSFADLTRQQHRAKPAIRAGGGAHLYSAADPNVIEIRNSTGAVLSSASTYHRSSSSPLPNSNYVVGSNVARASSAPSPPPPGVAAGGGATGGGASAEYLQRSRNRSVLATVKNALRDKAVVVEGGIYTAESREPSRRQHLHAQLKMARQLRSIFEAAATTAEKPTTTLEQRREIFEQNVTNMKRLVSLTEAVRGRYVSQSYDEYDEWEAKKKKDREEKLKTAKNMLRLHLKDMARERTPHLFAEEDERRRKEELAAAIRNGEDVGDEGVGQVVDDEDDDDNDDDEDYEDSAYSSSVAAGAATPSSIGDRASESKYDESFSSDSPSDSSDSSLDENLPMKTLQSSSKRKRRKHKKKMAKLAAARAAAVASGSPLSSSYVSPSSQLPGSKKRKKKKNIISSSSSPSKAMIAAAFLSSGRANTMDYSIDGGSVEEESKMGGGEAPHFATAAAAASVAVHVPSSSPSSSMQSKSMDAAFASQMVEFDPPKKCHYCRTSTSIYRKCHYIHKNGKMCNRSFCQSCLETKFPKIATLDSVSGEVLDEVDYNLLITQRDTGWHCPVCLGECDCKTCVSYQERKRIRLEASAQKRGNVVTTSPAASTKASSPSASIMKDDASTTSSQKASSSSPAPAPTPAAAAPAPIPAPPPKKKKRRSAPTRKCHDCKKSSTEHRRCHFWFMNGTKCGKIYCRKCLELKYDLEENTFEELTSDADWHCPSCLGTCECKPCVKARERSEKRSARSSGAMDRRSTTRTSAGFYSF